MRVLALVATVIAHPAMAQDGDPMRTAWDAIRAAMTGEITPDSVDRLDRVDFARFPPASSDGSEMVCEIVASADTPLVESPDDTAYAIAEPLALTDIPIEGLTRCIAPLPFETNGDGAAFAEQCTAFLDARGLRAEPSGTPGPVSGAAAVAERTVGDSTLLRAACDSDPSGNANLTLHFRGMPPMPE